MELRNRLKLKSMKKCLQNISPKWFCHLERMKESAWSKCRTSKLAVVTLEDNQGKDRMW